MKVAHDVSIVIPVLDRLEFTRLCLDRIWRNTADGISYEVIVVDNASTDGTAEFFADVSRFPRPVRYLRNSSNLGFAKGNNVGAALGCGRYLLFLNNDTLVQPGWLSEMLRICQADAAVGVVGIKQLFPYTNTIYHTGIVFGPEGKPEHLYPHLDASLPQVNKQRQYQAVTGACLLIDRALFDECGGFDERYRNGYEDVDLCLKVGGRGRTVVCCTTAFIYHYGQISEGRTAADDEKATLFATTWSGRLRPDRDEYLIRDRVEFSSPPSASSIRRLAEDCIYLADALDEGSALTWINIELALALKDCGVPVYVNGTAPISPTVPGSSRRRLRSLGLDEKPVGGVQLKWSHYRPRHLNLDIAGDVNLEFFVINYQFGTPGAEPWDFWLQCLRQNHHDKLPLSGFCASVLQQIGLPERDCHVWHPGYSREIEEVDAPERTSPRFRFLTVSNSHDLERYNTLAVITAFQEAFSREDDVALVIKDYGASSGDTTIRSLVAKLKHGPRIEYISEFTDKRELVRLYRSCDAFVSAHRGEGFGMKILDAMACGLPVITPLFGGATAYCEPDNCRPVNFSLVPMGDCLDTRSLRITNQPMWAEVDPPSLRDQIRRTYDDRASNALLGGRARAKAVAQFSWASAANRLIEITTDLRAARPKVQRPKAVTSARVGSSPYWLGLRVSVVVPTHNRKDKLMACLDALAHQSVLAQEFEVVVVDDGSTDGTKDALEGSRFPFALRYYSQDRSGPGAARNMGIERAAGEIVLFIGDDILADERLIEEHLLAHAANPDPGAAILGNIDWPATMTPNGVMEYVCGDAMLQFAYSYIPQARTLDHRFFYTSNISLKRQFLVDAADAGIRFDPCFRRAAFEDSEFAFRLVPRGLRIRYVESARAAHDHWMDLEGFARREFGAGEMAVIFYRKHPGEDEQLQVRWIADLVEPAAALLPQPDFLGRLEAFDRQTDTLLRGLAGSLEELIAIDRQPGRSPSLSLSGDRLRAALHNVLRVIFDVERTRGKLREWFSMVEDPARVHAAQTLASVMRKIEFLNADAEALGPMRNMMAPIDSQAVASLSGRIAEIGGMPAAATAPPSGPVERRMKRGLRRLLVNPFVFSRVVKADRFIEARLQSSSRHTWLANYRRVRRRLRSLAG
jgi:GT2 family glycosyltransferase/glycosyltransferase involved in cell wall biosynthesis